MEGAATGEGTGWDGDAGLEDAAAREGEAERGPAAAALLAGGMTERGPPAAAPPSTTKYFHYVTFFVFIIISITINFKTHLEYA